MLPPLRNERGYNLTNILVALGLTIAVTYGISHYVSRQQHDDSIKEVQAAEEAIKNRFQQVMRSDGAWLNTLALKSNSALDCLHDHLDCLGHGGPITLIDSFHRETYNPLLPQSGLTFDGSNCSTFTEAGNDFCPFRMELSWNPVCGEDCDDPASIELKATIRFKPDPKGPYSALSVPELKMSVTRDTKPGDPRTCYDHYLHGSTHSGIFKVKPDANSAGYAVYCDQERDGGGWALVAAGLAGSSVIPENFTVTPDSTGRLSAAQIKSYLDASEFQNTNDLRLELPEIDGGLILSASSNGAVDPDAYTAPSPAKGDCRSVSSTSIPATHHDAKDFSLFFSGHGEFGLDETSNETEGFHGFSACVGRAPNGRDCGKGCNTRFSGQVFRQKGYLWIR